MLRLRRLLHRLFFGLMVLATGLLPNHCATTVEDAVLAGVSRVITDTTAGLISSLLPFDFSSGGSGNNNNGNNGGGDPFEPPVQS